MLIIGRIKSSLYSRCEVRDCYVCSFSRTFHFVLQRGDVEKEEKEKGIFLQKNQGKFNFLKIWLTPPAGQFLPPRLSGLKCRRVSQAEFFLKGLCDLKLGYSSPAEKYTILAPPSGRRTGPLPQRPSARHCWRMISKRSEIVYREVLNGLKECLTILPSESRDLKFLNNFKHF